MLGRLRNKSQSQLPENALLNGTWGNNLVATSLFDDEEEKKSNDGDTENNSDDGDEEEQSNLIEALVANTSLSPKRVSSDEDDGRLSPKRLSSDDHVASFYTPPHDYVDPSSDGYATEDDANLSYSRSETGNVVASGDVADANPLTVETVEINEEEKEEIEEALDGKQSIQTDLEIYHVIEFVAGKSDNSDDNQARWSPGSISSMVSLIESVNKSNELDVSFDNSGNQEKSFDGDNDENQDEVDLKNLSIDLFSSSDNISATSHHSQHQTPHVLPTLANFKHFIDGLAMRRKWNEPSISQRSATSHSNWNGYTSSLLNVWSPSAKITTIASSSIESPDLIKSFMKHLADAIEKTLKRMGGNDKGEKLQLAINWLGNMVSTSSPNEIPKTFAEIYAHEILTAAKEDEDSDLSQRSTLVVTPLRPRTQLVDTSSGSFESTERYSNNDYQDLFAATFSTPDAKTQTHTQTLLDVLEIQRRESTSILGTPVHNKPETFAQTFSKAAIAFIEENPSSLMRPLTICRWIDEIGGLSNPYDGHLKMYREEGIEQIIISMHKALNIANTTNIKQLVSLGDENPEVALLIRIVCIVSMDTDAFSEKALNSLRREIEWLSGLTTHQLKSRLISTKSKEQCLFSLANLIQEKFNVNQVALQTKEFLDIDISLSKKTGVKAADINENTLRFGVCLEKYFVNQIENPITLRTLYLLHNNNREDLQAWSKVLESVSKIENFSLVAWLNKSLLASLLLLEALEDAYFQKEKDNLYEQLLDKLQEEISEASDQYRKYHPIYELEYKELNKDNTRIVPASKEWHTNQNKANEYKLKYYETLVIFVQKIKDKSDNAKVYFLLALYLDMVLKLVFEADQASLQKLIPEDKRNGMGYTLVLATLVSDGVPHAEEFYRLEDSMNRLINELGEEVDQLSQLSQRTLDAFIGGKLAELATVYNPKLPYFWPCFTKALKNKDDNFFIRALFTREYYSFRPDDNEVYPIEGRNQLCEEIIHSISDENSKEHLLWVNLKNNNFNENTTLALYDFYFNKTQSIGFGGHSNNNNNAQLAVRIATFGFVEFPSKFSSALLNAFVQLNNWISKLTTFETKTVKKLIKRLRHPHYIFSSDEINIIFALEDKVIKAFKDEKNIQDMINNLIIKAKQQQAIAIAKSEEEIAAEPNSPRISHFLDVQLNDEYYTQRVEQRNAQVKRLRITNDVSMPTVFPRKSSKEDASDQLTKIVAILVEGVFPALHPENNQEMRYFETKFRKNRKKLTIDELRDKLWVNIQHRMINNNSHVNHKLLREALTELYNNVDAESKEGFTGFQTFQIAQNSLTKKRVTDLELDFNREYFIGESFSQTIENMATALELLVNEAALSSDSIENGVSSSIIDGETLEDDIEVLSNSPVNLEVYKADVAKALEAAVKWLKSTINTPEKQNDERVPQENIPDEIKLVIDTSDLIYSKLNQCREALKVATDLNHFERRIDFLKRKQSLACLDDVLRDCNIETATYDELQEFITELQNKIESSLDKKGEFEGYLYDFVWTVVEYVDKNPDKKDKMLTCLENATFDSAQLIILGFRRFARMSTAERNQHGPELLKTIATLAQKTYSNMPAANGKNEIWYNIIFESQQAFINSSYLSDTNYDITDLAVRLYYHIHRLAQGLMMYRKEVGVAPSKKLLTAVMQLAQTDKDFADFHRSIMMNASKEGSSSLDILLYTQTPVNMQHSINKEGNVLEKSIREYPPFYAPAYPVDNIISSPEHAAWRFEFEAHVIFELLRLRSTGRLETIAFDTKYSKGDRADRHEQKNTIFKQQALIFIAAKWHYAPSDKSYYTPFAPAVDYMNQFLGSNVMSELLPLACDSFNQMLAKQAEITYITPEFERITTQNNIQNNRALLREIKEIIRRVPEVKKAYVTEAIKSDVTSEAQAEFIIELLQQDVSSISINTNESILLFKAFRRLYEGIQQAPASGMISSDQRINHLRAFFRKVDERNWWNAYYAYIATFNSRDNIFTGIEFADLNNQEQQKVCSQHADIIFDHLIRHPCSNRSNLIQVIVYCLKSIKERTKVNFNISESWQNIAYKHYDGICQKALDIKSGNAWPTEVVDAFSIFRKNLNLPVSQVPYAQTCQTKTLPLEAAPTPTQENLSDIIQRLNKFYDPSFARTKRIINERKKLLKTAEKGLKEILNKTETVKKGLKETPNKTQKKIGIEEYCRILEALDVYSNIRKSASINARETSLSNDAGRSERESKILSSGSLFSPGTKVKIKEDYLLKALKLLLISKFDAEDEQNLSSEQGVFYKKIINLRSNLKEYIKEAGTLMLWEENLSERQLTEEGTLSVFDALDDFLGPLLKQNDMENPPKWLSTLIQNALVFFQKKMDTLFLNLAKLYTYTSSISLNGVFWSKQAKPLPESFNKFTKTIEPKNGNTPYAFALYCYDRCCRGNPHQHEQKFIQQHIVKLEEYKEDLNRLPIGGKGLGEGVAPSSQQADFSHCALDFIAPDLEKSIKALDPKKDAKKTQDLMDIFTVKDELAPRMMKSSFKDKNGQSIVERIQSLNNEALESQHSPVASTKL